MSFYAKISLCALLGASSIIGMEQPPLLRSIMSYEGQARLQHPAQSAAAQALNQPMIEITCNGALIDKVQKNYLEASETFKNLLAETEHTNSLELPEALLRDYQAIKDLLQYEYHATQTGDEIYFYDVSPLNSKTKQQLVDILAACQKFEMNKMTKSIVQIFAFKLNRSRCKASCLQRGSYNLHWTADVARLIAKEIRKNQLFYMVLSNLTERKQGEMRYWHLYHGHTGIKYEISACANVYDKFRLHGFTMELSEHPELIVDQRWCQTQELINNPTILVNQTSDICRTPIFTVYWQIDSEILKIVNNLKPESVIILIEYLNKYDQMPLYLQEKLPIEIRKLLLSSFWQRRNWLSKAAIITGSAAATGLAAWLGYKYFSKQT